MNTRITIEQAGTELDRMRLNPILQQSVRDAAAWSELINRELRQQLGLEWDCTMEQLYKATVNLRDRLEGELSAIGPCGK